MFQLLLLMGRGRITLFQYRNLASGLRSITVGKKGVHGSTLLMFGTVAFKHLWSTRAFGYGPTLYIVVVLLCPPTLTPASVHMSLGDASLTAIEASVRDVSSWELIDKCPCPQQSFSSLAIVMLVLPRSSLGWGEYRS